MKKLEINQEFKTSEKLTDTARIPKIPMPQPRILYRSKARLQRLGQLVAGYVRE